jgi:dipeptidyl aminopeptidase/acylaminoacyl peptidase
MTRRLALLALLAGLLVAVPGPHDAARAAFPGKNGRIAFSRDAGGDAELWMVRADGSDLTQLTANADEDREASWSPDGGRIAFSREGPGGTTRIVVLDLEGGGEAAVTQAGGFDQAPDWSPDGTRIAFNRFLPGQGNRVFTVAPAARPSPSAPSAAPTTSTRPGPRTAPGSPSPAAATRTTASPSTSTPSPWPAGRPPR